MTTVSYSRRPTPSAFSSGFFDAEHALIQGAIQGVQDNVDALPPTTTTATHRTSDGSNATGSFASAGLSAAVANGVSVTCRWALWLGTSAGASGGINFRITYPTAGKARAVAFGIKSGGAFASIVSQSSPLSLTANFANADFSAGDGWAVIDAAFDAFSAAGTIDLQFTNASGGETAIIRRASSLVMVTT